MSTQYEKPSAENEVNEMGEDPPASGGDRAQSKERTYTSSNRNFEKELIYLKDPIGRKFQFPFKVAKTWHVSLPISLGQPRLTLLGNGKLD